MFSLVLVAIFAAMLPALPVVRAQTTVVPSNSFSSTRTFEQYWNYLYPWGEDHNGSGRMTQANIAVGSGTLTLRATPTSNANPPTSSADPHPAIHYASGAIHAKEQITVTQSESWTIEGEFSAPTDRGTWPAFWLTSAIGWPPEVDIGEWKGTAENWFNTFNTSSVVRIDRVPWPSDLSFQSLKAVLTAQNDADVRIEFYMNNELRATQYGAGFVDVPMWLIINLQMEGSSGTPGPSEGATYQARNVQVTRSGN
ncbi:glycoside hydrolase family 16 protein [Moniliophthora roreri MCA 2997]|uniref:Glycoside hydrolase family 16 protein n=1 Tax=Moniliophthora roreri (strain MCA 2997) TaxID=1381753 RepID=V2XUY0_MONRO|nr:glycoside hydrolase family 16 protein [Moniliophthora roreri MCA 2997]